MVLWSYSPLQRLLRKRVSRGKKSLGRKSLSLPGFCRTPPPLVPENRSSISWDLQWDPWQEGEAWKLGGHCEPCFQSPLCRNPVESWPSPLGDMDLGLSRCCGCLASFRGMAGRGGRGESPQCIDVHVLTRTATALSQSPSQTQQPSWVHLRHLHIETCWMSYNWGTRGLSTKPDSPLYE